VRRIKRRAGPALLGKHSWISGIWPVLAPSIERSLLFLQGVHPRTPAGNLTNLRRIVERGRQLLVANRNASRAVHDWRFAT
jgi:hypothetical protein